MDRHINLSLRFVLLTVASCGSLPDRAAEPAAPPTTTKAAATTPARNLQKPGVPSSDQPVAEVDPVYFALGALYEYAGYQADLSKDTISTFAVTDKTEAIVFARYLEQVAEQQAIDTNIIVRPGEGGCTVVASQPMKEYVVSLFPRSALGSSGIRMASYEMFEGHESKRSYLAGVYLRFKHGDTLKFANSGHKVRLVRELLIEMQCKEVACKVSPRGHYPAMHTISFVPSPELSKLFAIVDAEREAARRR